MKNGHLDGEPSETKFKGKEISGHQAQQATPLPTTVHQSTPGPTAPILHKNDTTPIPFGQPVLQGQETTLPHAFTAGTLHDPTTSAWNMDTDFMTRRVLLRCDSTGDLYPVTAPSPVPQALLVSQHTWHQRLGHPRNEVLRRLVSHNFISCNKEKPPVLCHACQLGKHVRLPFSSSTTIVNACFDIIHSDVWTSPVPSLSGFKYYVLFLDHYSHFVWVYPLINKSDVMSKFVLFRNFVHTQFQCEIRSFQCDHGGEFDNSTLHKLFADNGIQFRFSCPKTSQQNGKSERMVRTINNLIRTLLFQANLPPTFWVEALNMAVHLLNILPSTAISNEIPYTRLFGQNPDYSFLRTFGCLCYPHLYPNHKLEPRATPSIYLGQASNHRGYRCLDLNTNKIILSRHVTFDETVFPYGTSKPSTAPQYNFLDDSPDINPTPPPVQSTVTQATTQPVPSPPPSPIPPVTAQDPTPPPSPAQNEPPTTISPTIIPDPPHNPNPVSTHSMVTRFRVGTNRPTIRPNMLVSSISPLPKSSREAFNNPHWRNAMHDEYNALIKNGTWTLVPRPVDTNIIRCMWLFRHKYLADGTLSRYKARLVANGSNQLEGVDVDETFSPVVKPGTIRTVLSLAVSRHWPIHQLDVKNAFLHGDLSETVYMHQPPGFRDSVHPDYEFAGSLQYLTFTRPDISYAVQQVFLHMHDPRAPHLSALKRILRYVRGTLDHGLQLFASSTTSLVAYSDADWAGCPTTRRSTSGYRVFLGNNLLSWSSKRQPTISRSSAEAEYRGVANAVAETCWLRNLLRELHTPLSSATLVYCDNVSAVYLSCNPVQHQRTKHIEIDIHFVRDLVSTGQVRVLHVPSRYQYADIFTKGLPSALFEEFRSSLSVRCPPASTAGEC
ncbi:ribonuclease H-like domain-containing protein [Artemisia annua]|uniref:Ribonuclease H-like domain-containing protein n=1 Tax=Artemisia annua TaxID=35608 RepID=A0A2U1KGK3_ARTAN|nr:ribonuclease H-like domain-containing protein [Artemisia annua]